MRLAGEYKPGFQFIMLECIVRIHFDFPFRVARDRVYANADGAMRRGVSREYLSGSAEDVWNAVVRSMEDAGFRLADGGPEQKGTFAKQGTPSMYLAITPEAGANPTGPDVKGSIWISWALQEPARALMPPSEERGSLLGKLLRRA